MGIAKGSWTAGSIFGKNPFCRETGGTSRGGCHVAKRSSDPRQDFPEFELQGRDLMRVVGIVATFAPLGDGSRENSFYRAPGRIWAQETCAGWP